MLLVEDRENQISSSTEANKSPFVYLLGAESLIIMSYLFLVSIICILFLSGTVATYLGIENTVTFAYTPFVVYFLVHLRRFRWSHVTKLMVVVIGFAVFAYVFRLIGLEQDYFRNYLTFLVFPMLLAIDLENEGVHRLSLLKKTLVVFFIIECGIAIYEKWTGTYIFYDPTSFLTSHQLQYYSIEDWEFRSSGLFAHPLMNAMIVCVIMSFILISNMHMKYKLILFALGYASLWCFNARGAIIVSSVLMVPYLLRSLYQSNIKKKAWIYAAFILFSVIFVQQLLTTSLGGRLLAGEGGLIDGSSQARIDVFKFYEYITSFQLWLGDPNLYLYVKEMLHAGGVENGIVTIILREGIVFTVIILLLLLRVQLKQTSFLGRYTKLFLFAVFYIIGVMNPNLASSLPWTFWILGFYGFVGVDKHSWLKNERE